MKKIISKNNDEQLKKKKIRKKSQLQPHKNKEFKMISTIFGIHTIPKNYDSFKHHFNATKQIKIKFDIAHTKKPILFSIMGKAFQWGLWLSCKTYLHSPIPTCDWNSSNRTETDTDIFAFKELNYVNYFIIRTSRGYLVAIDTGYYSTKSLAYGLKADSVNYIFLTHSDPDHIGGVRFFKNATSFMSEKESILVNQNQEYRFKTGNKKHLKNPIVKDFIPIKENDKFIIDNIVIKTVLTSAHTDGSMCYLVHSITNPNHYWFFVGDALFLNSDGKRNTSFSNDLEIDRNPDRLKKSWDKIYDTCLEIIQKNANAVIDIVTSHTGFQKYEHVYADKIQKKKENKHNKKNK